MRWKLPNQDAKRGTQEKREGENTNTTHLAPQRAEPWKGKEKEKRRQTDTDQDNYQNMGIQSADPTDSCNYSLKGTVVQSSHMGINSYASSNELGAQYVQPHQIPKRPYLQEEDMPVAFIVTCHVVVEKAWAAVGRGFWLFRSSSHWKNADSEGSQRTAGAAGRRKMVQNRMADCFPLLKRITRLKCVNSEFNSVNIHPQRGCLKWPYGTMSEPP